jgi:uncharacterized protein
VVEPLKKILEGLKGEGKIRIALLYGSYHRGDRHSRSDIDLAIYLNPMDEREEIEVIDKILMSSQAEISILRLDDQDESPFVVQEALKGEHLIEPVLETLYALSHKILHECEGIKNRRELSVGSHG